MDVSMKIAVNEKEYNCTSCVGGKDYLNGNIREYIKFDIVHDQDIDLNTLIAEFTKEPTYSLITETIKPVEDRHTEDEEDIDVISEDIYDNGTNEEVEEEIIREAYDKSSYCLFVKFELNKIDTVTITMGKLTEQEIHIRELEAKVAELEAEVQRV